LSTARWKRSGAAAIARRWPRIGDHIAVLRLRPDHGIWFAATAEPGHITVSDPAGADDVALFISDDEGNIVDGPIQAVPASAS
jgi:hypothetical protein